MRVASSADGVLTGSVLAARRRAEMFSLLGLGPPEADFARIFPFTGYRDHGRRMVDPHGGETIGPTAEWTNRGKPATRALPFKPNGDRLLAFCEARLRVRAVLACFRRAADAAPRRTARAARRWERRRTRFA